MKLTPLASNMTEVETEKYRVLFSYKTPVAFVNKDGFSVINITNTKWSATTTRHINKWIALFDSHAVHHIEQEVIDDLFNGVK